MGFGTTGVETLGYFIRLSLSSQKLKMNVW
jgi:hypothetical protein